MSNKIKTFTVDGIVLKRSNTGETDRIVHLLTKDFGKLTCVAKGVRKITSSKRAFLEPGNVVSAFLISTKSLPILTQAKLIDNCANMHNSLASFRQLSQILEMYDKLFVEEEIESYLFSKILEIRKMIVNNKASKDYVHESLTFLITELGFQDPSESKYATISAYIEALSDSKFKSFDYLYVR